MAQKYKSAVHLFFIEEGKILLSRRANTGYMDGYYSVVAGHLEPGEIVVQSAIREAKEEAGITLKSEDIEVVQVMHRRSDDERIDFFVIIHSWDEVPYNAEPDKCDDLSWFPIHDLPENIVPYVRRAFENYENGQWFDTFGWE